MAGVCQQKLMLGVTAPSLIVAPRRPGDRGRMSELDGDQSRVPSDASSGGSVLRILRSLLGAHNPIKD